MRYILLATPAWCHDGYCGFMKRACEQLSRNLRVLGREQSSKLIMGSDITAIH